MIVRDLALRAGVALLFVALLAPGCATEKKDKGLDSLVSSLSSKLEERGVTKSVSKATEKAAEESAIPGKGNVSPEVKARREAWRAACKAVSKALVKYYAVSKRPAFGLGPVIQPMGKGRYRVYGYANTRYPNGALIQRAFDAWIQHRKCEKLSIDGKRVL